ncbi:hydrolase [Synechococcus phage S-CRES2]|nr:hydrolase [Synechococcus phage S-CRES2]
MSVDNTSIVVGSTTRSSAKTVVIAVTSTRPPEDRVFVENGVAVIQSQAAEREGQILMFFDRNTGESRLYVVADVDGTLTWVPVNTTVSYRDSRTGRDWDPLLPLYSYLAS